MDVYQCPQTPPLQMAPEQPPLIGCGQVFLSEPDEEGLVDCPNCGLWFSPTKEPTTVLYTNA